MKLQVLFLFLVSLILHGCKVGPDYVSPVVFVPESYVEDQPCETEVVEDEDLVHWWSTFNDPFLDELLETAIDENFDYKIALEQVYQARSQYWIQFTQLLPEFDASATGSHYKISESFVTSPAATAAAAGTISPVQNFYQVSLAAIWELDLFGKFRRSADASYDLWEATVDEMRGVKIMVISQVAEIYATICSFQQQRDIAMQVLAVDEELLALAVVRCEAGLADLQEVELATAQQEADLAQLHVIESALKQSIYSLAVLLGCLPETLPVEFEEIRPIPQAYGKVPVGLPSELIRRRPDIQAAERQLASATEMIGVAVANLFPSVSLTGSSSSFASNPLQGANVGFSSDDIKKLFLPASLIWGIGATAVAPVFDFGKRFAAIDVQISLRNQAYYAYQKTVILAFQEVEQTLQAYFNEEVRQQALQRQLQANGRVLELTTDLFQAGLAAYTQVLDAKEVWLASLNAATQSQQALTADLIAIYTALGGDW